MSSYIVDPIEKARDEDVAEHTVDKTIIEKVIDEQIAFVPHIANIDEMAKAHIVVNLETVKRKLLTGKEVTRTVRVDNHIAYKLCCDVQREAKSTTTHREWIEGAVWAAEVIKQKFTTFEDVPAVVRVDDLKRAIKTLGEYASFELKKEWIQTEMKPSGDGLVFSGEVMTRLGNILLQELGLGEEE